MVSCSAPVTFTFPGSGFEIKSHSYSEGWLCWLAPLSGQGGGLCENYYEKLYFKGEYLDLYALTECKTNLDETERERLVSIEWDDSVRVQGKPVFIARLDNYHPTNPDYNSPNPNRECAGMDSYYVIVETDNHVAITSLACSEVARLDSAVYQTRSLQPGSLFRRRNDASGKSVWEPLFDTLQTKLIPIEKL